MERTRLPTRLLLVVLIVTVVGLALSVAPVAADGAGQSALLESDDDDEVDEFTGCTDAICGERITDTTEQPYASVVNILADTGGGEARGSGVLVEPDVVVTAAHNTYWELDDEPIPAENVTVVPGRDGDERPFGEVGVEEITYDDWVEAMENGADNDEQMPIDFALYRLEEPIGTEAGTLDYRAAADVTEDARIDDVEVAGYPGVTQFDLEEFERFTMWGDSGAVELVGPSSDTYLEAGEIPHEDGLETTRGQSGSPIIADDAGASTVVGVLRGSLPGTQAVTVATPLTDERVAMIEDATQYEPGEQTDLTVELEDVDGTITSDAEHLDVTFTASNPLRAAVADDVDVVVDGTVVATVDVSLEPEQTETFTRSVEVDPVPGESLTVGVEATDDGDERQLQVAEETGDDANGAEDDASDDQPTDEADATDASEDDADDTVPGFGLGVALLGLLGAGSLLRRRGPSTEARE